MIFLSITTSLHSAKSTSTLHIPCRTLWRGSKMAQHPESQHLALARHCFAMADRSARPSLRAFRLAACALLALLLTSLGHAQTADERARKIVSRMALDEKIEQLRGFRDATDNRIVLGIPRLGIPDLCVTNGPAGAGPGGVKPPRPATALPAPIALASTWDRDLAMEYGAVAGSESRDLGNSLLEAPTINIMRVPQNGRTFEGYGEDPFLTGQLAVAFIDGVQSRGIMADVKHYVANNQETDRSAVDEEISERALREIYLPAFEDSVKLGHSASVMCAYPKVNGAFNCENVGLLDTILKKEWGLAGFVTSDFGAVHSTVESALAGLDLEMPTGKYFGEALKAAVEGGKVPMSVIDDKLIRRYRAMIQSGVFDHPLTPKPLPAREHGAIALRIAEDGIVLLKNSGGILPLKASQLKRIALIGPAKASTGGGGSSHVVPLYTVDPLDGLRSRAGSQVTIETNDGADIPAAAALAHSADFAIVLVVDQDREGHDQSLSLPGNQDELVRAVATANPRTVVVLKTGSAVLMPWAELVPAIVEAWYPGEEDGNAVAAILFGEVNPSGKLPITFPRSPEDLPASKPEQYPGVDKVAHYSEGVFVGYRHYDAAKKDPLFPFGHGLSYTTFGYANLQVSPERLLLSANAKPNVQIEFDVVNSGRVSGAEVAQLYIGMPSSDAVPQPPKQLKEFKKVRLEPGRKAYVQFALNQRAFSYWDTTVHDWKVAPGTYSILVGSSSRDVRLSTQIQIAPPGESH